jgi:hypothetical protein
MKIRPVGAELFHVDRRTDMTKLTVVFRNFANAPKNNRQKESLENTNTRQIGNSSNNVHITTQLSQYFSYVTISIVRTTVQSVHF